MGVKLWLDDKRPCPEGWVHAKTALEAIQILGTQEVDEAALDHDLGHCPSCTSCAGYKATCGCRCHWTGYTVALWMAANARWPSKKPTCHSSNPAGKANIEAVVNRYFQTKIVHTPGEFRLSWKEQAAAEAFRSRHDRRCSRVTSSWRGGRRSPGFTYKFTPTGIGVAASILCLACRRKKDITEYEAW